MSLLDAIKKYEALKEKNASVGLEEMDSSRLSQVALLFSKQLESVLGGTFPAPEKIETLQALHQFTQDASVAMEHYLEGQLVAYPLLSDIVVFQHHHLSHPSDHPYRVERNKLFPVGSKGRFLGIHGKCAVVEFSKDAHRRYESGWSCGGKDVKDYEAHFRMDEVKGIPSASFSAVCPEKKDIPLFIDQILKKAIAKL